MCNVLLLLLSSLLVKACFWGGAPEAPSNVDLVMSVRECIHPKPYKKRLLAERSSER